ncbi:MAG: hypothetical protein D6737_04430 [Chloroflexi bacterium]|nr:MAG: hypothetical protein D6737_04430 [Chloroflexota bacterium]
MSEKQTVIVKLDNRVRLISAVLALTDWPEKSQHIKAHGTHAHARNTRKVLKDHQHHPAVQSLQALLDKNAPLEAIYTLAMQMAWPSLNGTTLPSWAPSEWDKQLVDFYNTTGLEAWWAKEDALWQRGLTDAQKMMGRADIKPFMASILGDIPETLVFIPNISYPTNREIGIRVGNELICIAPPPLAWGDSPPWPFDEDPAYIYRTAIVAYGKMILTAAFKAHPERVEEARKAKMPVDDNFRKKYPKWEDQYMTLFMNGMVAIYLEEHVSSADYKAFVLLEHKAFGMVILPGVVSVLRRYLEQLRAGNYQSLADFLPMFPKQLRIAKRITTL